MTEDEALAKLAAITDGDKENAHYAGDDYAGDDIVEQALRALGWSRLADAYQERCGSWWYA